MQNNKRLFKKSGKNNTSNFFGPFYPALTGSNAQIRGKIKNNTWGPTACKVRFCSGLHDEGHKGVATGQGKFR